MEMSDVLIYIDREGVYHAMQPRRALRPETVQELLTLCDDIAAYRAAVQQSGTVSEYTMTATRLTNAKILSILLPSVDADELADLSLDDQVTWIVAWNKAQPKPIFPTTLSA